MSDLSQAGRWRLRSLLAPLFLLTWTACGGGGGGDGQPPPGVPVKLVLSESSAAPPAQVGEYCVVFTERPATGELLSYLTGRVPAVFRHVGRSVRQCMDGTAQPYLSQLPASRFFSDTLYINLDGQCPPHASGCYYDNNPTVDLVQTVFSLLPEVAEQQLNALIGHEIWHAVDGWFHS